MNARAAQGTKSGAPPARRFSPTLAVSTTLCLALGVSLVALGIPRTVAAWLSLRAAPTLLDVQRNKAPSDATLEDGIADLRRALSWNSSAVRLADLSILELSRALRLRPNDPKRADLLRDTEKHLVEGLLAGPTEGFAWFRLAVVRELVGASGRDIALALMQSLDMAPNMRALWFPRARMFMTYWSFLNPEETLAVRSQFRTIWTAPPEVHQELQMPLLRTAWLAGRIDLISWALGDDPQLQAQLDAAMKRLPGASAR